MYNSHIGTRNGRMTLLVLVVNSGRGVACSVQEDGVNWKEVIAPIIRKHLKLSHWRCFGVHMSVSTMLCPGVQGSVIRLLAGTSQAYEWIACLDSTQTMEKTPYECIMRNEVQADGASNVVLNEEAAQ